MAHLPAAVMSAAAVSRRAETTGLPDRRRLNRRRSCVRPHTAAHIGSGHPGSGGDRGTKPAVGRDPKAVPSGLSSGWRAYRLFFACRSSLVCRFYRGYAVYRLFSPPSESTGRVGFLQSFGISRACGEFAACQFYSSPLIARSSRLTGFFRPERKITIWSGCRAVRAAHCRSVRSDPLQRVSLRSSDISSRSKTEWDCCAIPTR
jgi:hypothetical protein